MTSEEMVVQFHRAVGIPVADEPTPLSEDRLWLRLTLIAEEVAELVCAMTGRAPDHAEGLSNYMVDEFLWLAQGVEGRQRHAADFAEIAKEVCDVHVVVSGTAAEYGIPEDRVYAEVHRSNMAKVGGPVREDGKMLKPDGWTPPDVKAAMA